MGEPPLSIGEVRPKEGVHCVTFDVVLLANGKVICTHCKLCIDVSCHLKLSSTHYTIYRMVMYHLVTINPQGMGDHQKVGDTSCCPRCRRAAGCDTDQVRLLELIPGSSQLSQEEVSPSNVVLGLGCSL